MDLSVKAFIKIHFTKFAIFALHLWEHENDKTLLFCS